MAVTNKHRSEAISVYLLLIGKSCRKTIPRLENHDMYIEKNQNNDH